MNVLFMSLGTFYNLNDSSVHLDILKRFAEEHEVWLVCKNEDRPTELTEEFGIHVLRVHTGELKKVGLIQKGINTIKVEPQFKNAIKSYLAKTKFDLVLYTTPPITFASAVKYVKKRDGAITYLMLKDIFPQNAVDIGRMSTSGVKGLLYKYFRNKEKGLYKWSDYIGCMSPANCEYVIKHNPEVSRDKVEVCPNVTIIEDKSVDEETRYTIRTKYGIPLDKRVFVYGGNLGKPQDISFVIECLRACEGINECYFLIIGGGTEYKILEDFMKNENPRNSILMSALPKADYETMVAACDVGMIFLDHRFTIPNFPSRMLSYMKAKVPILAVTDPNTDVGKVIVDGGFGWWCESNAPANFAEAVQTVLDTEEVEVVRMKDREFKYMETNYSPDVAYNTILRHFSKSSENMEHKI